MDDLQTILRQLADLGKGGANAVSIFRALAPAARIDFRGIWLPNLVLFGQIVPSEIWAKAVTAVEQSDCLVVVGTSLTVYPAALLVKVARRAKTSVIQVDPYVENKDCVAGFAAMVLPNICI